MGWNSLALSTDGLTTWCLTMATKTPASAWSSLTEPPDHWKLETPSSTSCPVRVAERFLSGELDFPAAGWLAACCWTEVVWHLSDGDALPEPAFSIYEAFDRGEYLMPDERHIGIDPVEKYTIPLLTKILSGLDRPST